MPRCHYVVFSPGETLFCNLSLASAAVIKAWRLLGNPSKLFCPNQTPLFCLFLICDFQVWSCIEFVLIKSFQMCHFLLQCFLTFLAFIIQGRETEKKFLHCKSSGCVETCLTEAGESGMWCTSIHKQQQRMDSSTNLSVLWPNPHNPGGSPSSGANLGDQGTILRDRCWACSRLAVAQNWDPHVWMMVCFKYKQYPCFDLDSNAKRTKKITFVSNWTTQQSRHFPCFVLVKSRLVYKSKYSVAKSPQYGPALPHLGPIWGIRAQSSGIGAGPPERSQPGEKFFDTSVHGNKLVSRTMSFYQSYMG